MHVMCIAQPNPISAQKSNDPIKYLTFLIHNKNQLLSKYCTIKKSTLPHLTMAYNNNNNKGYNNDQFINVFMTVLINYIESQRVV